MTASRPAVLAYGLVVYAIFQATFLYCVGFVSGVFVPRDIDTVVGAEAAPLWEALAVNGGLLGLFAVQHLIMARRWFKERWTRIIPAAAERSTFVLATCAILVLMFFQWRAMPGIVWDVESEGLRLGLNIASALGWVGVLVSTFLINHFDLFGLSQTVRYFRGQEYVAPRFEVKSFYRYTRHPLYVAFFIAFWCSPTMTLGHLFFAAMCTGFVLFAVRFEERDLVAAHGDDYRRYQRDVPMLLPSLQPAERVSPETAS